MLKSIKNFLYNMVCDAGRNVNSKIVMGILSFIVASVLAFIGADTTYVAYFLAFSGGSLGFSCFDNNSAFKFQNTNTKTETTTSNKTTTINVADIVDNGNKVIKSIKGKK